MIKKSKLVFLVVGILLLIGFAGFSKYISQGGMRDIDLAFTVKLQEKIDNSSRLRLSRLVGEVMEGSSFLASPTVSVIFVIFITVINFIKSKTSTRKLLSLTIPLAFTLLIFAEVYGKSVVEHPAPPFFLLKNPTTIFPKYHVWEDYSYPSGHAARAVFISITMYSLFLISREAGSGSARHDSLFRQKRSQVLIVIGLGIYVLLISVSRIYLGHHWFSDVFGGWLLGAGLGILFPGISSFKK